tara:strand:- start:1423 stop:2199 length:777 start_codon:yes stop_codon:yes gene_type:complete
MPETLKDIALRVVDNKLVICVFANKDYLPVLNLWEKYFSKAVKKKFLVFSFDEETFEFCKEKKYETFFSPYSEKWGLGFMRHMMYLTREIINLNFSILVSDIDAIWLKDPLEFTTSTNSDLIFSPGTIQPPEAFVEWGNVLCCGYFLIRPSLRVNKFLDCVEKRMEYEGDQPAINKELLSRNLKWQENGNFYGINFCGHNVIQSVNSRVGQAGDISVTLLPNRFFQRLQEKEDALVFHPIAPKECATKLNLFKQYGIM